jgi:hypothetical protein
MPLSPDHQKLLSPLFAVLPLAEAMPRLLPGGPAAPEATAAVRELFALPEIARNRAAQSALWLYVDDLHRSHEISQGLHTATGSFLHGIMHRREGDFWNSHYWMRKTHRHPVWQRIAGYDPDAFIDAVQSAQGTDPTDLLTMQRTEWAEVMAHCLEDAEG